MSTAAKWLLLDGFGGSVPAPVNSVLPSIDDLTPVVDQLLTGDDGEWLHSPTSFARRWYRDGVAIGSATNQTYTTQAADFGKVITYGVIATGSGGESAEAVSAGTGVVGMVIPEWATLTSTLREDFENAADWSVVAGSTPTEDAVNFRTGSKSLRITNTGVNTFIQKTVSFSLAGDTARISLDVYKHGGAAASSVFIYMYANVGSNKVMEKQVLAIPATAPVGWYHTEAQDFQLSNGMTWNDTVVNLRVFVTGSDADLSVDNFCTNVETNRIPMALFAFDDGYDNLYTQAYPLFSARSLHATAYIITNQTGTAGKVTNGQIQTMQANAWSIANHTSDHTTLTTLTQAQQEATLDEARDDLVALSLTGGEHVAYPAGAFNAATRLAMIASGMLTGRTVTVGYNTIGVTPLDVLNGHTLNASVSLATAKGYADAAVTNNTAVCFVLHGVVAGVPVSLEWNVDDLEELIAYCIAQGVPLISIEDYYALLSQDVTVPG